MSIETTLDRIADALDCVCACETRRVELLERQLAITTALAESRGLKVEMPKAEATITEAPAEAPVEVAEPACEWTYEDLKAELIKRGADVPKGTKMTTLLKKWETYKDVEPTDLPGVETPEAPVETVQVVEENPAAEDFFAATAPAPVDETPMTVGELQSFISNVFPAIDENARNIMRVACKEVCGSEKFVDLSESKYRAFAEAVKKHVENK